MEPACRDRIYPLEHLALAWIDRQDHFGHGCRASHEALRRIEIDGTLVGEHSVGLASHALQQVASPVRPSWLLGLLLLDELIEIDIVASNTDVIPEVVEGIRALLMERHRDEEDFTITTQTEMLDTFGKIIGMITIAVSGIAGVSLLVGAMGIFTIMWISVHERTNEIGLLRALGVPQGTVQGLFLLESVLLAVAGGAIGLIAGFALIGLGRAAVPGLPLSTPPAAVALGTQDLFKNLISGILVIAEKRFNPGDWIRVDGEVEGAGTAFAFPSRSIYMETVAGEKPEVFVPPGQEV